MTDDFTPPKLPAPRKQISGGSKQAGQETVANPLAKYVPKQGGGKSYLLGLSDATSSMTHMWQDVQRYIDEFVARVRTLGESHLQWLAYRDYSEGDRVIEKSGWSTDSNRIREFIAKIKCFGGDDFEEAVERALQVAADDKDATRVLLIGDAPPHPDGNWREQARRLKQLQRPVFCFLVGNHPTTKRYFDEIATITGGISTTLTSANDLLDKAGAAVAHDMGGGAKVDEYVKKFGPSLTAGSKEFAKLLKSGG